MASGKRIYKLLIRAAVLPAALLFFVQCGNKEKLPDPFDPNDIKYSINTEIGYDYHYPSSAGMLILSTQRWEISVTDAISGDRADWLTFSPSSGSGDINVNISNTYNRGPKRTAKVKVAFETSTKEFTITQEGYGGYSATIPGWLELPEVNQGGSSYFLRHYCALDGKQVRNYSALYDAELCGSYWVAYPLHTSYLTGADRSEAWAYDTTIPALLQFRYHNLGFGFQNYDRGHQLPSGDRTATDEMNKQTFYSTNITPQRWRLNQVKWKSLEEWFRGKASADTVWMVTGAVYRTANGSETIQTITNTNNTEAKRGEEYSVSIPNYYFKIGMKRKDASSYTAVGFWYDNQDEVPNTITRQYARTVKWIEEQTGINFFANLPGELEESVKNISQQEMNSEWGLN